MTIDGANISYYGFRLLTLTNWYGLPARKAILREPAFLANDMKYEARKPVVKLFGKFDDLEELNDAVDGLIAVMRSTLVHAIVITRHGMSFNGVFDNGMKATVRKNSVTLEIPITVQE
jgi:hypothetical protein